MNASWPAAGRLLTEWYSRIGTRVSIIGHARVCHAGSLRDCDEQPHGDRACLRDARAVAADRVGEAAQDSRWQCAQDVVALALQRLFVANSPAEQRLL